MFPTDIFKKYHPLAYDAYIKGEYDTFVILEKKFNNITLQNPFIKFKNRSYLIYKQHLYFTIQPAYYLIMESMNLYFPVDSIMIGLIRDTLEFFKNINHGDFTGSMHNNFLVGKRNIKVSMVHRDDDICFRIITNDASVNIIKLKENKTKTYISTNNKITAGEKDYTTILTSIFQIYCDDPFYTLYYLKHWITKFIEKVKNSIIQGKMYLFNKGKHIELYLEAMEKYNGISFRYIYDSTLYYHEYIHQ